jgi:hypothetical protein
LISHREQKKHRLRAFDKRILGRISGPKRDEMAGGRRKLQNEEFHNLYCTSSDNSLGLLGSSDQRG